MFSTLFKKIDSSLPSEFFMDLFSKPFFDKFNETVVEELQNVTDYEKLCDIMKAKSMLIGGYIFIANLYKYKIVSYDTVNKNYQSLINLTNKAPKDLVGKYIDAIISILWSMIILMFLKAILWKFVTNYLRKRAIYYPNINLKSWIYVINTRITGHLLIQIGIKFK